MNYADVVALLIVVIALFIAIIKGLCFHFKKQINEQKGCPVNLEEILENGDKIEVKEIYKEYAIIVRMNFEYIPYDNGLLFINTKQTLIVGEVYCYNEEKNSIKHIPQEQIPAHLNCLN